MRIPHDHSGWQASVGGQHDRIGLRRDVAWGRRPGAMAPGHNRAAGGVVVRMEVVAAFGLDG